MRKGGASSRERLKWLIVSGETEGFFKGELVIEDGVIRKELGCEHVGFTERKAFVEALGLDLVTVSPRQVGDDMYEFPDLQKWVTQTGLFTFAVLDGAFERGMRHWEFGEFFHVIKSSPLALKEWIHSVENLNLALAQRLEVEGVNGVILADDVAFAGGLMVHPRILREHFIPSLSRQVETLKQMGFAVFYHSDGNYRVILEDILRTGVDGLHCIDRNSGMKMTELPKETEKLCLWGHLDVADLEEAAQGSEPLRQKVEWIEKDACGRRLILGTSSGLFEGVNIEGLKALYRCF